MNYAKNLGNIWFCFDCAERAEGNPRLMTPNILTADWEGFQYFSRERCGYCYTPQGGTRHRFTVWGN